MDYADGLCRWTTQITLAGREALSSMSPSLVDPSREPAASPALASPVVSTRPFADSRCRASYGASYGASHGARYGARHGMMTL